MNPYVIIVCMLALAGAAAGGFKLGADHELATQVDKQQLVSEAVDAANNAAATAIAALKIKNTTINNEVQHEIRTNTIYGDCNHSAAGVRLVNSALDPVGVGVGGGKLPKVDPVK